METNGKCDPERASVCAQGSEGHSSLSLHPAQALSCQSNGTVQVRTGQDSLQERAW